MALARNRNLRSLVISLALLISAMIATLWYLDSSKVTESFLITKADLASGSPLLQQQLQVAEVSLFGSAQRYLKPEQLAEGSYLIRPVAAGELIPRSAVTTQTLDDWSNLVITPGVTLSNQIRPGSNVTLWASPQLDYRAFGEPVILALDVEVVRIGVAQGNFSGSSPEVELRLPVESIQAVLQSIANGDLMALTSKNVDY